MNLENFELYSFLSDSPEKSVCNIFFAHANGIPALTYQNLFQQCSKNLNINIITYDMRGIGKTKMKETMRHDQWSWQLLIDDHIFIFEQLKKKYSSPWILSGHSLGAWLSLLSSEKLNIKDIILFDPPILPPNIVMKWLAAVVLKKTHLTPNGMKAKRRTTRYNTYHEAFLRLKSTKFMRNWPDESIKNYLEGSFSQEKECIQLRHNPEWEAYLFEQYPTTASIGFLRLSHEYRKKIKPVFLVGEKSDTCNPKAKLWVKLFFPKLRWILIKNGTHMFPIELQNDVFQQISKLVTKGFSS